MAKNSNSKIKDIGIMPLVDRVLIKPFTKEELESKNSFGIILPNQEKENGEQGVVVSVSSSKMVDGKVVPVSVKVGDKVAFSKYGYESIKIDGVEYYFVKEDNLLAVIK